MKILCMGKITYDYSLPIDGFPIEGLKYDLKDKAVLRISFQPTSDKLR